MTCGRSTASLEHIQGDAAVASATATCAASPDASHAVRARDGSFCHLVRRTSWEKRMIESNVPAHEESPRDVALVPYRKQGAMHEGQPGYTEPRPSRPRPSGSKSPSAPAGAVRPRTRRSGTSSLACEAAADAAIFAACDQRDFRRATTLLIHAYAARVRAFLNNRLRDSAGCAEVFAVFSEDVWKGIASLRGRTSVVPWVFVLARNALYRHGRAQQRWAVRHVSLDAAPDVPTSDDQVAELDGVGHAHIAPLLHQLSASERWLLDQRFVAGNSWNEIARAQLVSARPPDHDAVLRESARLRKKSQLIVQRLRLSSADLEHPEAR
jgi:DNA-directed RNA polymerase specialized sigma24 family protein